MNEGDARLLARKVFDFLSQKSEKFKFVFSDVPVLSQNNGYDCGVHVLCNAEHATR
jgi:Ulp1 family protease